MTENYGENIFFQLQKFKTIAFVPKGNSMYPFIKDRGNTVYISIKEKRLSPFDIGLFIRKNGTIVLHRVIEVLEDGYLFCGDSVLESEKVLENDVIGFLTAYEKGKKKVDFSNKDREKAEKWYKKSGKRKLRLKLFFFNIRVKNKLKRIFKREEKWK